MGNEQPLSERELEILRMVATGASNKVVAQALAISPNTVKVHLRNIFAKIGVESRMEATLYALRTGLVSAPASSTSKAPGFDIKPVKQSIKLRLIIFGAVALLLLVVVGISGLVFSQQNEPKVVSIAPTPSILPARWQVLPDLPQPRAGMAAVAYENTLYLIGGETPEGISPDVIAISSDINVLREQATKPTAVRYIQAVVLGEKIYVPGGELQNGQVTNVLEVYNPRLDTWSEAASLPHPVSRYALAALEGRLYLFGGWDSKHYSQEIFLYDPQKDTWQKGADLPGGRADGGAAAMDSKIMIVGGTDGRQSLNECLIYRPDRDKDKDTPWEKCRPLPNNRFAMGVTRLAGSIYVVGGRTGLNTSDIPPPLFYNQRSGIWQVFDSPPQGTGSYPALVSTENSLQLLGGRLGDRLSASHQSYLAIFTSLFPIIQ